MRWKVILKKREKNHRFLIVLSRDVPENDVRLPCTVKICSISDCFDNSCTYLQPLKGKMLIFQVSF